MKISDNGGRHVGLEDKVELSSLALHTFVFAQGPLPRRQIMQDSHIIQICH